MNETVLDVLMYLFENYLDGEFSDLDNHDTLKDELVGAGFSGDEVEHAFSWLNGLAERREQPKLTSTPGALRIYVAQEIERLSTECRGFLLYLEQLSILNGETRELAVDRLMAINDEIDLERVKWVVLLVLVNQPGGEDVAAQMEDLVYYEGDFLH